MSLLFINASDLRSLRGLRGVKRDTVIVAQEDVGVAESVAAYEQHAAELESRLPQVSDAKWDSPARLLADGKVMWETTLGARTVLADSTLPY